MHFNPALKSVGYVLSREYLESQAKATQSVLLGMHCCKSRIGLMPAGAMYWGVPQNVMQECIHQAG